MCWFLLDSKVIQLYRYIHPFLDSVPIYVIIE